MLPFEPGELVFFLTAAGEGRFISRPRECRFVRRMGDTQRDDYMLVDIAPPVIDRELGLGVDGLAQLLLASRHVGFTLFPVTEWPTEVYVARITNPAVVESGSFTAADVDLIAWATVLPDRPSAEEFARMWQADPD